MTAGDIGQGGTQAQLPPAAETSPIIIRSTEPLVNFQEIHGHQICDAAEAILDDASTIVTLPGSDGEDVRYRVSLGTEHFPPGELTKLQFALHEGRKMPGFNLRQVYDPKNQKLQPIYLVAGDTIEFPVAIIWPSSDEIFDSGDPYDRVTEKHEQDELSRYISAIGADSYERLAEQQAREKAEGREHKETRRHRIKQAIGSVALVLGLTFGGPPLVEGAQQLRQNYIEQQAEQRAADRAAELQREADARQAKAEREAKVRDFDAKYSIDGAVEPIQAGAVGVAQATDAFIDVKVPRYNSTVISQDLAHNLSSPRAIDVHQASQTTEADAIKPGVTIVDMPIRAGQTFKVTHNGDAKEIVTVYFNAATNQLEIRNFGQVDGSPSTATQVFVQVVPS